LPGGTGSVTVSVDASGNRTETVTVTWIGPDKLTHTFVTSTNIVPNT
jgi:hypothetical protein